jgi:hypothetical protein
MMGTPQLKSKDDMRRLKEKMEEWMKVREETARRQVSDAEEELKRILGENTKVKKAIGLALAPLPQDELLIRDQRREGIKLGSPCHKPVCDSKAIRPFDEPLGQQPYESQDTTQTAGFLKELEQLRLQVTALGNENRKLESTHKIDREIIEGLRLEMQEAITELDELRTRHTAENVHSASDPTQQLQHGGVYVLPTSLITPQGAEAPHNLQSAKPAARSPCDSRPPKVSEEPMTKRKKKKAAVMPTPIKPVLFVDPANPRESLIQSYQQKMYLLQVKVHSRLPVDVRDIPWPVLPPPGKAYPITIHGRKEIKSADVMKFAEAFWIGGKGLAKERAVEMISAWTWMCPTGRVKCTKDLGSWIGRTTTFLHQAKRKLGL